MRNRVAVLVIVAMAGGLLAAACAGGGQETTLESGATDTPAASATATSDSGLATSPADRRSGPPLEGASRGAAASERTNYRELDEFRLPEPEELPPPPEGATGPEFQPPVEPQCPEGWQELSRPAEGFRVCHPEGWSIDGHGYVSAGAEDRWYSLGLFLLQDAAEVAHVSIYVVNPYAKPITYTRDCDQAYRVTFAGDPAALCPNQTGEFPEAKIIAYHVRRGDLDYYINIVPQFQYDATSQTYLDNWSQDAEATGIRIAHTLQFMEIATP